MNNRTSMVASRGVVSWRTMQLWVVMLMLTGGTYIVGTRGFGGSWIIGFVLLTVLLKGYWIIADFMALRHCAFLWRAIMLGWLVIVVSAIAWFTL